MRGFLDSALTRFTRNDTWLTGSNVIQTLPYSYRSASIGFRFAAFHAG
jgi:hypothetical protein